MDSGLLWVLVACIVNGVFDCVVVAYLAGKRSQKALENWIHSAAVGGPEEQEVLYELFDMIMTYVGTREIKTGKKIKVDTGEKDENNLPITKEQEEVLTPIQLLSRSVGSYATMHVKGFIGGKKTQANDKILAIAQSGGSLEDLLPVALDAAARGDYSLLLTLVTKKVFSAKDNNVSGGGSGNW
jgi:hypothetical protein